MEPPQRMPSNIANSIKQAKHFQGERKMKKPSRTTGDGIKCPHCTELVSFELKNFSENPKELVDEYASQHMCICPNCNDILKIWVLK